MGDAAVATESLIPKQASTGSRWGWLSRAKEKLNSFRRNPQAKQESTSIQNTQNRKEDHQPLTISQLKEMSKIPRGSGYERLIDEYQKNETTTPDVVANELARLYPDFSYLVGDNPQLLQRLNSGDKELIRELSDRLIKEYSGNENFDTIQKRVLSGKVQESKDLKVVLANQLKTHLSRLLERERINQSGSGIRQLRSTA